MILRGTTAPYPTANHQIARQIVGAHPQAMIGLEDLTDIRERTKPRKRKRKKGGKGSQAATSKMRKANRVRSQWSFAELQALIAYKAVLAGSLAIKVEAQYTSKACPKCGFTHEANRPNKGLVFHCGNCHYELHADLVGARNLVLRTRLPPARLEPDGALVSCPRCLRQRSQSLALAKVQGIAVELRVQAPEFTRGVTDQSLQLSFDGQTRGRQR